jgi:quinol monooxygenase YgiN
MAKRVMIATMKANPGQRDELLAQFGDMFAAANAEIGTEVYTLVAGDDPDTVYMIEQYSDQAAMDAHMASETLAALYTKIGPFMADGGAVMGTVFGERD